MTKKELKEKIRPLLRLNFDYEGNIDTLVNSIRHFIKEEIKKGNKNVPSMP